MSLESGHGIMLRSKLLASFGDPHPAVTLVDPANAHVGGDLAELLVDKVSHAICISKLLSVDDWLDVAKHSLGNVEPRSVWRQEQQSVACCLNGFGHRIGVVQVDVVEDEHAMLAFESSKKPRTQQVEQGAGVPGTGLDEAGEDAGPVDGNQEQKVWTPVVRASTDGGSAADRSTAGTASLLEMEASFIEEDGLVKQLSLRPQMLCPGLPSGHRLGAVVPVMLHIGTLERNVEPIVQTLLDGGDGQMQAGLLLEMLLNLKERGTRMVGNK